MTMPHERRRAIIQAATFMESLLDRKKTPRVPSEIRRQARQALRHYPTQTEVDWYWRDERLDHGTPP